MKKKAAALSFVLMLAVMAGGCAPESRATIKIIAAIPVSGAYSQAGEGAEVTLGQTASEINAGGGVHGRDIEMVYEDSGGEPSLTVDGFVYKINQGEEGRGEKIAKMIRESGCEAAAVIYERGDYGRNVSDSFIKNFQASGGNVPVEDSYLCGYDRNFSFFLDKIKASEVRAVMLAGYHDDVVNIIKQAGDDGIDAVFYVSERDDSWAAYWQGALMLLAGATDGAGSIDKEALDAAAAEDEKIFVVKDGNFVLQ